MKLAKGPRPWPVRAFVGVVLLAALATYIQRLTHLDQPLSLHGFTFDPARDHDLMIVVFSAQLTIVLIPLAMIWLLASNLARWLVTVMSLVTLPGLVTTLAAAFATGAINLPSMVLALVPQLAFILLFLPAARLWFGGKTGDAATFA